MLAATMVRPARPRIRLPALALALSALGAACHSGQGALPPVSPSPSVSPGSPSPSGTPTGSPSPAATCAEQTFASMTEAQRVGQLIHLGLGDDRLGPEEIDAVRTRHIGSVWFIATTTEGATAVKAVADAVQKLASKKNTAHVEFFVAANQEGGLIQGLRGPGFSAIPSAVDQGKLSTSTLQADAQRWGGELVAAGVNMNFAPVMDVVPA